MRYVLLVLVLAAPAALATAWTQSDGQDTEGTTTDKQKSAAKAEPLRLSDDGPLLRLDEAAGMDPQDGTGADNSRCQVCHLNLALEELSVTHARNNIGCADCHGDCDAHIDDACGQCHDSHDVPASEVLQRWQQFCPEKTDVSRIVCTDCHGKHRLNPKLRKAWWDKNSGEPTRPENDDSSASEADENPRRQGG